jgi:Rrf2 family protein
VRISAKVDYAVRAMAELAALPRGQPVTAETLAEAQDIPVTFLLGILGDLKQRQLVRSQRGRGGGYLLAQPAESISLADIIRAVEGPLANVRDMSLTSLRYHGPATKLKDVWMAVRGSLRSVLETVTIADLAAGRLPPPVADMAHRYRKERRYR